MQHTTHHFGHAAVTVDPQIYRDAFGPGFQMQIAVERSVESTVLVPADRRW